MRMGYALVLVGGLAWADGLGGCWNGVVCTANVVPGVVVRVTNAQTGEGIGDAVLALTEGEYREVLGAPGSPSDSSYYGAEERPGTYTLTVEAAGFVGQTIENVVVELEPSGCHVITVELTVELTPAD